MYVLDDPGMCGDEPDYHDIKECLDVELRGGSHIVPGPEDGWRAEPMQELTELLVRRALRQVGVETRTDARPEDYADATEYLVKDGKGDLRQTFVNEAERRSVPWMSFEEIQSLAHQQLNLWMKEAA